ncbi:aldehyde dehydrogenase family protein [Gordonia terrae]|uniref:Aldehyde dehydrogenase n=2 Tax=Gordonia terrae TaxID=2055 RepID=A0AAD0NU86_9ACTN|nr:aldehyde dehydrogenase family protein [Gordonia terrae]VTR09165.1 aldehyde dehydrogenase [Clostridioides difficile]ANY21846.1 betaine-aldehyde dehydrogenase [Gordonia terrae]AWO82581.1 aldehyde dehydrogenase [Gordonia terrae]VTS22215.1 Betaine aldehyde dehydrogenase [Gordonia terrae]GAB44658.1 putative aldehyde dehydrogenase [Gordonia terrae NBRC 100016]
MTATGHHRSSVDGTEVDARAAAFLSAGTIPHVIEGERRMSRVGGERPIMNPSTGNQIGVVADGDADDLDDAVRSARAAFEDGRWRLLAPREKEERLHRLADLIAEQREVTGDLDGLDAGIVRKYASFVSQASINALRYYAGWPTKISGHMPPVGPDYTVTERIEPIGVMGVIKPWNGPAAFFNQVAPALAAGNSVVLKPAEHTPLTATYMALLALEAGIPPGVLNVVHGAGAVGSALVAHPGVNRLSFTGSVNTGRALAAAAAQTFKKVNIELGGKSPVVVFPDADLDLAASTAAGSVWNNSGQVCTAGSRTLVHRDIYDDFLERAVKVSENLTVGHAFDEAVDLGPLITPQQRDKVRSYVDIGRAEGATVRLAGGAPDSGGNFQAPVIFADVDMSMRVAREEIFGPVMSVIPFDTEDQAYRIANDTEFGLAAGVFTRDIARVERAADVLDAGTVWINCYQVLDAAVSFGGAKYSGYGRSLGSPALEEYTRRKSVWSRRYR